MALNYSHRPVFPGHMEECNFGFGRDCVDHCRSPESASGDIADLLPSDPFGMDIQSTVTAITGWLEDLKVDCGGYIWGNSDTGNQENNGVFTGWNLIWNNAPKFQGCPSNIHVNGKLNRELHEFPCNIDVYDRPRLDKHSFSSSFQFHEKANVDSELNHRLEERDIQGAFALYDFGFPPASNMVDDVTNTSEGCTSCSYVLQLEGKAEGAADSEGVPHEALAFALGYLGVKDLLSVERVCRSLCSTVRDDPLLWMSIHIDKPLNERVTDDILVQLTSRAQGNLQCLSLVECPKISDDGLRRILEINPRLDKLCVPGCTRLSVEGIVNNIKMHHSNKDVRGIKHLQIAGLYGVTHEHYGELKSLLGADRHNHESRHKPHFYHQGNFYLPLDDDCAIDVEMCVRCEKFRLVYDCPTEACQIKDKGSDQFCRACILCIPRCAECGRCINNTEYVETFCLVSVCSECFKKHPDYEDRLDNKVDHCGVLH